jgi:hypothetical protein
MARLHELKAHRMAIGVGVLLVGLVGGCGGDDDDSSGSGGSGGTLALAGSSTGAVSGSGGNDNQGAAMSAAGAAGQVDTSTGGSTGGSTGNASAGSGLYLRCASQADCKVYGGGKVCCAAGSMQFCTKPSGCTGKTLP